mgnify:CR=1 FL=1
MYGAAAFPGTATVDEEFRAEAPTILGLDGNVFVGTSCLGVLASGIGLALRERRQRSVATGPTGSSRTSTAP